MTEFNLKNVEKLNNKKYFAYADFTTSQLLEYGKKYSWCEDLTDSCVDAGSHVFEYSEDYINGSYYNFSEAIEILKKAGFSDKEINANIEELQNEYLRSLSAAYSNDYECKAIDYAINHIEKIAIDCEADAVIWLRDNKPCYWYEANEVRFCFTQKTIKKIGYDLIWDYAESKAQFEQAIRNGELTGEIAEYIDNEAKTKIDWSHFDYYGTVADYDNWLEYFEKDSEAIYILKQYRQAQADKVKKHIKANKFKRQNTHQKIFG
jgi:hypothetical protein